MNYFACGGASYETIYEYGVSNPYNFTGSNPYSIPLNSGQGTGNFYNTLPINMNGAIGIRISITYGAYNGSLDMSCRFYIGTTANPTTNMTRYQGNIGTINHILPPFSVLNKYLAFNFDGYSKIINNTWRSATYQINKIELIRG